MVLWGGMLHCQTGVHISGLHVTQSACPNVRVHQAQFSHHNLHRIAKAFTGAERLYLSFSSSWYIGTSCRHDP